MIGEDDAVSVLLVHFQEIFGTQFLVANVALDSADLRSAAAGLQVDAVHLQHVRLHEVLVA